MQSQHCRLSPFARGVLAPSSAITCAKARAKVRLTLVSSVESLAQPTPAELLALVEAEARGVARQGDVPAEPVIVAVQAAFRLWPAANHAKPEEVKAWARQTALVVAGERISHQHALKVAERERRAERAGTSPEDVAQHVSLRWFEQPPSRFDSVPGIKAWAGQVAIRHIIDQARRQRLRQRAEDRAHETSTSLHALPPKSVQDLAAEHHDVYVKCTIIAAHLGPPRSKVVRQFWIEVVASMMGIYPIDAETLAKILDTTPNTIYQNRARIREVTRELHEAFIINFSDLDTDGGRTP